MASNVYDVAVVGLGAVGSAAIYRLGSRGARAVGVDRFDPPHDLGSSHGESRITREAVGEGLAYVPLALRSHAIWEGLEAATGERLLERCGFLYITRDDANTRHHGKDAFLKRTVAAAHAFGIAHELLDASDLNTRFPQFTGLAGDEQAYHEPGGGYLRPERCIAACLSEARRFSCEIETNRRVLAVEPSTGVARIETSHGPLLARRVILAAGSWMSDFLDPSISGRIAVHRQVLHWFPVRKAGAYPAAASPTFIWTHGSGDGDQFYGFPPIDGEVKLAREDYDAWFDPERDERSINPAQSVHVAEHHVRGRLAGLSDRPSRSRVCHYAVTPDNDFLIDTLSEDVIFASACSGHGFKHAAAVGEALADWALGEEAAVDLSPFSAARFRHMP